MGTKLGGGGDEEVAFLEEVKTKADMLFWSEKGMRGSMVWKKNGR